MAIDSVDKTLPSAASRGAEKRREAAARKAEREELRASLVKQQQTRNSGAAQSSLESLGSQTSTASTSGNSIAVAEQTSAPEGPRGNFKKGGNSRIIHFAVQGGTSGNGKVAVFSSGDGPNSKKVTENDAIEAEPSSQPKVETVA